MPSVNVVDTNGRTTGIIDLAPEIFAAPVNPAVLHEVVRMQEAGRRQGTASTKTRGFVSGTGKKPYKQKHTGRARAGSIRSPLWRHGGIIFGPLPRDYSYRMPKKKARGAVHAALSTKVSAGALIVLDEFPRSDGKAKALARLLATLGLTAKTLVVAGAEQDQQKLRRAANNLPGVTVLEPDRINVRDLLLHDKVLIARRDLSRLQELWT
jgi:large subunit ribosomal protein L4